MIRLNVRLKRDYNMIGNDVIRLSKSDITDAEMVAVNKTLEAAYLGMGKDVFAFEANLSEFFGGRKVVCVNSGTAALQLGLQACGIGHGDEVITPTMSYIATHQAIAATGATVVLADIKIDTGFIDVEDIEKKITDKTKAVVPVHYASDASYMNKVFHLAKKYKIRVIEDAAHSFGSKNQGRLVGSFGDITCFSFDGIKNITSGEGGCLVTNDDVIVQNAKDARLLGVMNDSEKRAQNERSWEFDVHSQGWRYHMQNMNAAIGLIQLSRIEEFQRLKRDLVQNYLKEIANIDFLNPLKLNYDNNLQHIFPVFVEDGLRDKFRNYLASTGIQSGIHYQPVHLVKKFKTEETFPKADYFYEKIISLPFHTGLCEAEFIRIINAIKKFK